MASSHDLTMEQRTANTAQFLADISGTARQWLEDCPRCQPTPSTALRCLADACEAAGEDVGIVHERAKRADDLVMQIDEDTMVSLAENCDSVAAIIFRGAVQQ